MTQDDVNDQLAGIIAATNAAEGRSSLIAVEEGNVQAFKRHARLTAYGVRKYPGLEAWMPPIFAAIATVVLMLTVLPFLELLNTIAEEQAVLLLWTIVFAPAAIFHVVCLRQWPMRILITLVPLSCIIALAWSIFLYGIFPTA